MGLFYSVCILFIFGGNYSVCIYLHPSSFLVSSCVVVEDSAIGLAAAKAAGMKCIVTKSG